MIYVNEEADGFNLDYILIHSSGIKSEVTIFGSLNHFLGATTILSLLLFNQTAHQAKELLGIMKCLQWVINCK